MELVPTISPYDGPLIFVGFGGARPFDAASKSANDIQHLKLSDCNENLDSLIRSRVFPDRAIRKWQYYARKDGHFLLEEGIVFDDGELSDRFIESGSDSEEDDEDISGIDDSYDDSSVESESD